MKSSTFSMSLWVAHRKCGGAGMVTLNCQEPYGSCDYKWWILGVTRVFIFPSTIVTKHGHCLLSNAWCGVSEIGHKHCSSWLFLFAGVLNFGTSSTQNTILIELSPEDTEYITVEEQLQGTIREHKDNCGGTFNRYNIIKVWLLAILMI